MSAKSANVKITVKSIFFIAIMALWMMPAALWASIDNSLWIGIAAAPAAAGPECEVHGNMAAPASAPTKKSGAPTSQNDDHGQSRGGRPNKPKRFESEHRPKPERIYYLKGPSISPQAEAYMMQADGTSKKLEIKHGPQPSITVKTPMGDGVLHGGNYIYVVDRQVKEGVLNIRAAKWLFVHHSCGWGHDYRNDKFRNTAHALHDIPLEILVDGMWDTNFHAGVSSGEELAITVMSEGVPVEGATVTITTEKKWSHSSDTDENGLTEVQLIKDYYPTTWEKFNRSQQGRFTLEAQFSQEKSGQYNGQPYNQIHYTATFPWKYSPAHADYNSYGYGLGLGSLAMVFSGFGIYRFRSRRKTPYKGIDLD